MKTLLLQPETAEFGMINPLKPSSLSGNASSFSSSMDHFSNNGLNLMETTKKSKTCTNEQPRSSSLGGSITRTRTHHSLSTSSSESSSSSSSSSSDDVSQKLLPKTEECLRISKDLSTCTTKLSIVTPSLATPDYTKFGSDIRRYTNDSTNINVFDGGLRKILEPHMRKARLAREQTRQQQQSSHHHHQGIVNDSIASSIGVPYIRLRSERPFLYDTYTHPVHEVLAEILNVKDLTQLHLNAPTNVKYSLERLMAPLTTNQTKRQKFQESYDSLVTSFCIPLLHSMAISQNLFHGVHSSERDSNTNKNTRICYRYQAFPTLRVVRPGDTSTGPQCDTAKGHSIGYLHFHIPLTPAYGTNALYTESHPGKEDWHALQTKSVGLGFLFDGGRCIHFNLENTTDSTMIAIDFVVAIYADEDDDQQPKQPDDFSMADPNGLCNRVTLNEDYFYSSSSSSGSSVAFYEEAVIDIHPGTPFWQCVAKKRSTLLPSMQHPLPTPPPPFLTNKRRQK